ncbi:hypothetical protein KAFR_0J02300 [Kazachstania africana CBS 2517]|uniref:THO complex subunit 2 n=1 Tax=Kazachstania africana (strain ATCC 22294 / BCRC 22015 / CBS 2517 / CECT 1963 / NBRC 1671 / NRRL Y-8276) TaxID=1071382 RepID=H2B0Z4_KAZAF|nr:hypothetical protein KAFR_0J02300 [Kazachstania africana CBS 2517]CCF60294.1 hypothetical protein KAFR_0J02300 [Kazachstania africana CBS 2517]
MSSSALISRINQLASGQDLIQVEQKLFDQDSIANWDAHVKKLCDEFKEFTNNSERAQWLKSLFIELFQLSSIKVERIADLIEKLSQVQSTDSSAIVGKMFIATTHVLPKILSDEKDLIDLIKLTPSIHDEIFKFSWLSSKLTTRGQTQLLKHLLKKSKYELKKYNLLTENSVGFSQLTTFFTLIFNDNDKFAKIPYYINEMYYIIGKYSLDTMRCLDLFLLISSEFITDNYKFVVEFLQHSDFIKINDKNITLANVVSFTLNGNSPPDHYYDLCAILVKYEILDPDIIWDNIAPTTESLNEFINNIKTNLEKESMKGVENPLAMAAALTDSGDDENIDDKDTAAKREDDLDAENSKNETSKGKQEMETKENEKTVADNMKNNGKIEFLKSLLIHGCLAASSNIIKRNPEVLYIDPSIGKHVTRIFKYVIETLYEKTGYTKLSNLGCSLLVSSSETSLMSQKPRLLQETKSHDPYCSLELNNKFVFYFPEWSDNIEQVTTVEDLFTISHEFYALCGPYLAQNSTLLSKLCRIGISDIQNSTEDNSQTIDKWTDYLRKFLFPTIPMEYTNPIVADEIYSLMSCFSFEKRYFIYNEMLTKTSQDSLILKANFNKSEREARSILKSLSTDTIDKESRKLSDIVSLNPLATLVPVLKQIENYDKVSELVIYTAKFFNNFAYDVLQYVLLLRLTQPRSAIQEDGVNQAQWVQRLSTFISGLAKNCPNVDLSNIIIYIIKTLHQGNIIAVSILKELITTVAGIRDVNNVNVRQLLMLNSGEPLKQAARKLIFDSRDANSELGSNLVKLFSRESAISEIMVLLYNLNLKANTQEAHYKILSARCDEMNTLLYSFIELVKFIFGSSDDFIDNVLSFDILIRQFGFSTPWVFHIWRDYMDQKNREREESEKDTDATYIDSFEETLNETDFEGVHFERISRDLFTVFWKLSLYDIHFDRSLYDERKATLEGEIAGDISKRKKQSLLNQIKEVMTTCISHQRTFNKVRTMLDGKSKVWSESVSDSGMTSLIQYCIVPRVLFSPSDALYSSYFLSQAFTIEQSMKVYDILVNSNILSTLLFSCTISEAGNLGIFFTRFLDSFEKMRVNGELSNSDKRELYNWHTSLVNQLIDLLGEKNYMSIRNGIEFMRYVSDVFPIVDSQIKLLYKLLEQNLVNEQREDIKLPTNALIGHLKARLRKESLQLDELCDLNEEESEEKAKRDLELEEIRIYETMISNEAKQQEIRKKLEINKLRRENEPEVKEVPKERRKPRWSLPKVFNNFEEVIYSLQTNNLNRASTYLEDPDMISEFKELRRKDSPMREYRASIFGLLSKYFSSLVNNPRHPDFKRKLNELEYAMGSITRQSNVSAGEMYTEQNIEPSRKTSRYNSDRSLERGGSRTTRQITPQEDRMSGNAPKAPLRMKSPTAPRAMKFPEKPSSKPQNHQNRTSSQPRGPAQRSEDRAPKRFKSDTGDQGRQFQQQHQQRPSYQGDSNRNDRSRFGNSSSTSGSSTRKPANADKQRLPQGPKGSSSYGSRYQPY